MIKVDRQIPIPDYGRKPGPRRKYPWLEMEVGDSFLMPKGRTPGSQVHCASKRYDRTFMSRKTSKGYRVWRTA